MQEERQLGPLGKLHLLLKVLELRRFAAELKAVVVQPTLANSHDLHVYRSPI